MAIISSAPTRPQIVMALARIAFGPQGTVRSIMFRALWRKLLFKRGEVIYPGKPGLVTACLCGVSASSEGWTW